MLVLKRRVGESILIGDDIVVTVCSLHGDRGAGIGIEAPKSVSIVRAELAERIESEGARHPLLLGAVPGELSSPRRKSEP